MGANDELAADIFNIMWLIWFSMNQLILNGKSWDFREVIAKAWLQKLNLRQHKQREAPSTILHGNAQQFMKSN